MEKITTLIFLLMVNFLNAQFRNQAIIFSYGNQNFTELKSNKLTPAVKKFYNGNFKYKISPIHLITFGINADIPIYKRLNLSSGCQIAGIFSKQYAEGQLFADDFKEICTLHDSCSYASYKLSEYLLKIPVLLNWNTKNEKIRLYLGLSNYSILKNHYSYEVNESSIHILKNSAWSRGFSQFPNRYLNFAGSIGAEYKYKKLGLGLNYEIFYNKHFSLAASQHSTVQNFSMLLKYYYH